VTGNGSGREGLANVLLALLLIGAGAAGWWIQSRPALIPDVSPLVALPRQIGVWDSQSVDLDPAVEAELAADLNLQRVYRHAALGDVVWLYVGYYGTSRGGRPEHTPRGCYPGAGWTIEASRVLPVGNGSSLRVNEYRVRQGDEERLVHFWYRSHRRTGILGGFDQSLDHLIGRLQQGRADGALVRISARLADGGESGARSRLLAFAAELDPLLASHWPREQPGRPGG
jgi:EpsI family protein